MSMSSVARVVGGVLAPPSCYGCPPPPCGKSHKSKKSRSCKSKPSRGGCH